ncbi:SGNH/GDSL hydrolase family protein [Streptomyces sp. NBC_00347]|uniref:SGNH/GDSL hydrolase family protein n=1 Tax=Streptomyces sp. NBC_00347 TaxID=2975721 RepID=UPI002254A7C7|nr:SGNH/GDSL hydrolase family protein [Streptomyces sp. NBC_00347]MCX5122797.1 SGNH/GDSL hydrolase family protein [Streptomyces sp. NBC_00347]
MMRLALTTAAAAAAVFASALAPQASAPAGPLSYVALGDSYSAASFVRPWNTDGCGRSEQDYPHQAARRLKVKLTDVTCSAAEVRAGLLGPQSELKGPPSVPPPGGWAAKPAQIKAVTAAADLVTVGAGGNSVGFAEIVEACVKRGMASFGTGSPCTDHYARGRGAAGLDARFTALEADFAALLKEIRTRAPRAGVAVVGYPAVVDSSAGCTWGSWRQFGTVAKGDMPWLDSVERRLNNLLREQARRSGAVYVDTYSSSTGHGVCAAAEQRWMYGIKDSLTGPGEQSDPPSELCRSIPARGEACTVLHPNLRGATHQADRVTEALTALGATRA